MAKVISKLSISLGATVSPFVSAFKSVQNSLTSFKNGLASAGMSVVKFTGLGALIGGAFAALKGAASGISLAAELEQTGVAFETMLGSAAAAQQLMGELKSFAASTPFEFPELASGAKQLVAFGISADQVVPSMRMLGDLASGLGQPLGELTEIYGKLKTQGRLYGDDLKQLAGRGVPIIQALAKQFGVAEGEVAKLVEGGKVGFADVQKALASMTGEGGQFAGMMAKQSQTLKGLWSTLSDNIGLTMADIVTKVVDAFRLKAAIAALSGFVGTAGAKLTALVSHFAPIVLSAGQRVYNAIVSTASAAWSYLSPIVTSVAAFISQNAAGILASTTRLAVGVWDVLSGAASGIYSVVTTVGTGLVTAWNWAMGMLGLDAMTAANTTGGAFQTIVDWTNWLREGVGQLLTIIGYGFRNLTTIIEFVALRVAANFTTIGNVIAHTLTEVVPAYLGWFAQNFVNILTDAFNVGTTIASNGIANVARIVSNLPGLIAGTTTLGELWTPLTDGFVATVGALPEIAARVPGELESALHADADKLGSQLTSGLFDAMNAADKEAAKAASAIGGAASSAVEALKPPEVKAPEVEAPKPPGAIKFDADTSGLDSAKEKLDALKGTVAGSAEAMRDRLKLVLSQQDGAAAVPGAAQPAAGAAAKPLPQQAQQAASKAARESKRDEANNPMLDVMRAILAELKGRPGLAFADANLSI